MLSTLVTCRNATDKEFQVVLELIRTKLANQGKEITLKRLSESGIYPGLAYTYTAGGEE